MLTSGFVAPSFSPESWSAWASPPPLFGKGSHANGLDLKVSILCGAWSGVRGCQQWKLLPTLFFLCMGIAF